MLSQARAPSPWVAALMLGALVPGPAAAQILANPPAVAALPITIAAPKALNLGSTSFFDGFGRTTEGFTVMQYGRYEDLDRITDYRGDNSTLFKGTRIQVFSTLTQIVYASGWHPFGGDAVGFSAALPLVDLNSSFAANSPVKLSNNGFGLGDLVWGPSYQSRVYLDGTRPVFSWRFQLMIMSPTGNFNKQDAINQSAGYWGVNPYVAFTWLPLSGLEFTSRLNYQYNLPGKNFSDPPPIPGLVYTSGQAGQLVYGNYDASYELFKGVHLGINGYFLDQLTPDRTNGQNVPHSRESEISVGPGGRYDFDLNNFLNLNLYLPVMSRNASPGPQVNVQYIHRF